MANVLTSLRILCSIALLFYPAFSPLFYVLYSIAGLSDMIDGTIARKTGTVSEFGAQLDTAADFVVNRTPRLYRGFKRVLAVHKKYSF